MRRINMPGGFGRLVSTPAGTGLILACVGLIVWTALSVWGGAATHEPGPRLREAWDIPAYFYIGLPVMVAAVAVAAFLQPQRSWRWPLCLVAGHQAGVLLVGLGMQSGFSLVLLTLMLAVLLVALFAIPAVLGSMVARWLGERAY